MIGDQVEPFKPYRRAGGHRTKNQKRAEGFEALRLKRLGYLDKQIADQLGMKIDSMRARLSEVLKEYGESSVVEYRQIVEQQLDMLLQAVMPRVQERDMDAVAEARAILNQKSKLLGLEAPVRTDVTVVQMTAQERELADLIAQAERDAKLGVDESIIEGEVVS